MAMPGEAPSYHEDELTTEAKPSVVEIIPASAEGQERVIAEAAWTEFNARKWAEGSCKPNLVGRVRGVMEIFARESRAQVSHSIQILEQLFPDHEAGHWRRIIEERADAIAEENRVKRELTEGVTNQ